ncbi:hypothetical protein ASD22_05815 [Rhodanobacter sp. Root480]|uniref:hypothetical protein n=1 Tax=Rhodanobacter sp. Root480 TaxID=1736542 RepID=UPI0006F739A8|nr:hypothetical protein [Rhodanobacter sp. Root480]KQX99749.1 hypothetical protein ASD22_05815 [Rhodanobacter sp. Root480]
MTRIFIEDDYDSFADFHDKGWLIEQFDLAKGSHIEKQVSSFGYAWWGHARAFILPWLFIGSIHDLIQQNPLSKNSTKQAIWDEYLKINGFKAALWKVAESSYCGLYYAYELLLVGVVNALLEEPASVAHRGFNVAVTSHFGQKLSTRLWNDPHISTAREIRNCLVHNGGAASGKLLKMQNLPMIDQGQIMISASDARALYSMLRVRVQLMIKYETSVPGG